MDELILQLIWSTIADNLVTNVAFMCVEFMRVHMLVDVRDVSEAQSMCVLELYKCLRCFIWMMLVCSSL